MKNFEKFSLILVFIAVTRIALSQCNLVLNTKIKDKDNQKPDTTNISILVGGAVNNNLSTPAQGLCGVAIKFKHPFVKELFVELISPSGQKIRLIGGNITSYFSDLTTWDISFVPCMSTPAPDLGFLPRWENDQDWEQLTTYTGQYHPNQGCLENFNSGPVNGTWTLRCIDNVDGGEGVISSVSLIFCQSAGVACGRCLLDPGVITNPDQSYCKNDPNLNLSINKLFLTNPVNNSIYSYKNVIFKDQKIFEYKVGSDFSAYDAGKYTICGLQYLTSEESTVLPILGTNHTPYSLDDVFFSKGACASVSDSCMVLTIENTKPITKITEFICEGSSFVVNGTSFREEGKYLVTIPGGLCDSIVELDLKVLKIPVAIESDRDVISCLANTNTIYISPQLSNIQYKWFTQGGKISGDTLDFAIDATQPGLYCSQLTLNSNNKTCKDTLCKRINPDFSYPTLTFDFDTLTCKNNSSTEVIMSSTIPIINSSWISRDGNSFSNVPPHNISVQKPGRYIVTVTVDNGCTSTDSIYVEKDTIFNTPTITVDTITCYQDTSFIGIELDTNRIFDISWGSIFTAVDGSHFVTSGGIYPISVIDRKNGCGVNLDLDIIANDKSPSIQIISDTIDCLTSVVNPTLVTDGDSISYEWNINGTKIFDIQPNIINPGIYTLKILNTENGCENSATFEVIKDINLPVLTFTIDSISCLKDSVQINTSSDKLLTNYDWKGIGFNYVSALQNPYVKFSGNYLLEYVAVNGCIGKEIVFVPKSVGIPNVILQLDTFRCGQPDTLPVKLLFAQDTYQYDWNGPSLTSVSNPTPNYWLVGEYYVTITNTNSGCKSVQAFTVIDDRIYSDPMLSADTINCINKSVQITVGNPDIVSGSYVGPSGVINMLSPFVSETGTYYGQFTNTKNCISLDTINIEDDGSTPTLTINLPKFVCGVSSINASASSSMNGTKFEWRTSNAVQSNTDNITINKGEKWLRIVGTAPNGCFDTITLPIIYDTLKPEFIINPVSPLICKDSIRELTTNYTNSASIQWLPNAVIGASLIITEPGQYIAVLTSQNNCSSNDTVLVTEEKIFPTYTATSTIINCKDMKSKVNVTVTSAYESIRWSANNPEMINNGILNFETSFSGKFDFEIENDEGCIVSSNVIIKEDIIQPKILSAISDTIDCNQLTTGLTFVTTNPIKSIIWNGPNTFDVETDSILQANVKGTYYASIIGENFCRKDTFISVIDNLDLPVFSTFSDTLTCDKGKVTIGALSSNPTYSYFWTGPDMFENDSKTIIVFKPGEYTLLVTAPNGCKKNAIVDVYQDIEKPVLVILDTFYIPCDTSAIQVMVSSTSSILRYKWLFPDSSISSEEVISTSFPGRYEIQIVGQNGCLSETDSFYMVINTTPPGFSVTTDTITCKKPTATLKASSFDDDVSYLWSYPGASNILSTDSTFITSKSGNYKLIVSNFRKCRDSIIIKVPIDTLKANIILTSTGQIECAVADVIIDGNNTLLNFPNTVTWSTTDGNILEKINDLAIRVDKPGNYSLSILNKNNGCEVKKTFRVDKSEQGFTDIQIETQPPSCEKIIDGQLRITSLNGTPPYKVSLNGSLPTSKLFFESLNPGNYLIEVSDSLGCIQTKNVIVDPAIDLDLGINKEYIINFGDSITLSPKFVGQVPDNAFIFWVAKGDTLCSTCQELTVKPTINTIYEITYGTDPDCIKSTTTLVRVVDKLQEWIPNIIVPGSNNADNSRFYIQAIPAISEVLEIKIFDTWAECVYQAKNLIPGDKSVGWDGTFNGAQVKDGVYIVVAKLKLFDGREYTYRGDVTVMK
jgi:subtilisin-like proprotein convertase family protein